MKALAAHATQVKVDGPFFALSDHVGSRAWGYEFYRLVRGAAAGPYDDDGRETSLLNGLPGLTSRRLLGGRTRLIRRDSVSWFRCSTGSWPRQGVARPSLLDLPRAWGTPRGQPIGSTLGFWMRRTGERGRHRPRPGTDSLVTESHRSRGGPRVGYRE